MDEHERLERICESFYDVGDDLSRWFGVLKTLANHFDARGCDLHMIRNHVPAMSFWNGEASEQALIDEYAERFIDNEPRSRFLKSAPAGALATDLQLVSRDVMRTSDYYADYLQRCGIGHCIAALPLKTAGNAAYFGIHFRRTQGPPEAWQLDAARFLMSHLNRALRAQFHLADARLRNALYSAAFDTLGTAMLLLGERGNVLVENDAARRILRGGSVFGMRAGKLVAIAPDESARLQAIVDGAIQCTGNRGGAGLFFGKSGTCLSVLVTPMATRYREHTGAAAMVAIVSVDEVRQRDRRAELRSLFSLTFAEARVANLLAAGLSARALADELGVTYETARTTIKQVYAKAGVKRQGELVALVQTLVPAFIARDRYR